MRINKIIYIGDRFKGSNGTFEIKDKFISNGKVYLTVYHLESYTHTICEYKYFKHLDLEED